MPAPGGNFAGARSDSRGYAGNSSNSSRSGAGGGGGVRNSSSGTRESAGSQARSGGSTGNTSRGGMSTGNTSRGGNSLGGGLASASGSAGRAGAGSGPSRTGGGNGAGARAAGLAGAAAAAYGGRSNAGGLLGGRDSSGTGLGGLVGAIGARSPESRMAQIEAVRRGPGILAGTIPSLSSPTAARRTATALGLSMAERYGLDANRAVAAMNQMAKTMAGETAGLPAAEQAAAARSMFNRMDVASAFPAIRDRQYTTDPMGMLRAYDANGLRPGTVQNAGFRNAVPGTPDYADSLAAIASGMSPYGNLQSAPSAVADATNYHNPTTSNPSWGRTGTTPFGAHSFSNPDIPGSVVAAARNQVLGSPGGLAAAVNSPAAGNPWERAQPIPSPREQVNGYLGGISGTSPQPSTFPGRPGEMVGGFPAAPRSPSTFPGRPEFHGAFPAEDARPSTFPGRPEAPRSFGSTVAGRPDAPQSFAGMVAGRPEFTGSYPAAPVTGSFPARPEFRGPGFPAAPSAPSEFPARPEFRGPGFPAAPQPYQNPPRSFGNIPANRAPMGAQPATMDGVPMASAPPQQQAPAPSLAEAVQGLAPRNPPRSFASIPKGGLLAAQDDGSLMNRLMGATGVPAPSNDMRDVRGGQPVEWSGNEAPQQVASMQRHVEDVLRAYFFGAPETVFPQYTSEWANLPKGAIA